MLEHNDNILIKEGKNGIKYLQYKRLLDYGIKHAYTLTTPEIDFSFNRDEHDRSYKILAEELDIDVNNIVEPVQTHTDKIVCLESVISSDNLKDVDGLITNKQNIAITSKNADCILFLFYDPIEKVIANVHSGWKGTFQSISEKTVKKMIEIYGCLAENILCFISPSIRACHFEVDEDVKDICLENFKDLDTDSFINIGEVKDGKQKYLIDTVEINKILLKRIGLKEDNIVDSELCSVCNKEYIHSARAEGEGFKRETAIIMM